MEVLRATEAECQKAIVEAAMIAGWRVHAERTSRTQSGGYATAIQGHAGFPDLVLVRGDRVMVVELKRKPNRVEDEQRAWLDALSAAGVETRVCWVPEGQDEFIKELTKR
jgi:hypothetical protein